MTRVNVDLAPWRVNAHLSTPEPVTDLVRRMQSRFRFDKRRGYWLVPMKDLPEIADELRAAGYQVVIERWETRV